MEKLAKISAIVLIILGILVIAGGFSYGIFSTLRLGFGSMMRMQGMPFTRGLPVIGNAGLGLVVMAVSFIQGIIMFALGEGLFLLAKITEKSAVKSMVSVTGQNTPVN